MALVTVPARDVGTSPIGPDAVGTVVFTLPRPAISVDGVHVQRRIEAPTDADGNAKADLVPYSRMLEPVGYELSVEWKVTHFYGPNQGRTATSRFERPIYVEDGGGRVMDMIRVPLRGDTLAVALLTPELAADLYARGIRRVIDNSTTPPALYRLEA